MHRTRTRKPIWGVLLTNPHHKQQAILLLAFEMRVFNLYGYIDIHLSEFSRFGTVVGVSIWDKFFHMPFQYACSKDPFYLKPYWEDVELLGSLFWYHFILTVSIRIF